MGAVKVFLQVIDAPTATLVGAILTLSGSLPSWAFRWDVG